MAMGSSGLSYSCREHVSVTSRISEQEQKRKCGVLKFEFRGALGPLAGSNERA